LEEDERAWKADFKIEGKDTEALNKEAKIEDKKDQEVANWDEIDIKALKSDQPAIVSVSDGKKEEAKDSKSASDITFGRYKPTFNTTGAKGGKKGKIYNAEEFPDIGGAVAAKIEEKEPESNTKKNEPQNRFEVYKKEEQSKEDTKEKKEFRNKVDRPSKPVKDEFFGNFRENNKNLKVPQPESIPEVKDPVKTEGDKPAGSSGGPPVFFTNTKKNAHTMAKAAEEAEKVKSIQVVEEETKKKYEDKPKNYEDKPRNYENKREYKGKDDKFERKEGKKEPREPKKPEVASKPIKNKEPTEEKKPKVILEKADLSKNEWGEEILENLLLK